MMTNAIRPISTASGSGSAAMVLTGKATSTCWSVPAYHLRLTSKIGAIYAHGAEARAHDPLIADAPAVLIHSRE
jgi:hypothetical protein